MNDIMNEIKQEEIAAGVVAQFDPVTGEFLGYKAMEADELVQTPEDKGENAETIH
jgi:hypothetical protein